MEENKKEEGKEGSEEEKKEEESPSESLSIVDEAKKVRDQIKAENDRREEILQREEKLKAENMLAGTGGGAMPPVEKKELTPKEYKDAVESGDIGRE